MEEAYAAVYTASETTLVVVYALRFASAEDARALRSNARMGSGTTGLREAIGSVVVVVSGEGGPCLEAVEAHISAVAN